MINQLVVALAISAVAALPSPTTQSAILRPVACTTQDDLFAMLNAGDRNDIKAEARLVAGACQPLAGLHYEIVDAENGILTLRLFPHPGDWATSRLGFTTDDMVSTE